MHKFDQVMQAVEYAISVDEPVIVYGEPGIGKTEMAEQLGEKLDRPVWLFNSELYDTMDAHGIPVPNVKLGVTQWMRPNTLPFVGNPAWINEAHKNRKNPPILFLDEINRASPAMQSALHPAVLKTNGVRKIGEHHLQAGTVVIAAANRKIDKSGVNNLQRSLNTRFTNLEMVPDLEQWIANYALKQGGNFATLVAFLRLRERSADHKERIFSVDPSSLPADCKAYPNPRSWSAAAKFLDANPATRLMLLSGKIGETAATALNGFLEIMHELPTMRDIYLDPQTAKLPTNPAAMFAVAGMVAYQAQMAIFGSCIEYAARLGREFEAITVRDATKRNADLMVTPAYIEWAARNQDLLN